MRRRNFLFSLGAVAGMVFFFFLLVHLLLLRYERGDIYPEYSTFRADPLGARALYESLESIDDYQVARGFKSLHRDLEEKPDSIFYLGLRQGEEQEFTKDEIPELDNFVKNGGRVIITFAPASPFTTTESEKKDADQKKADEKKKEEEESAKKKDEADKSTPEPEEDTPPPKTEQEKFERDEFRTQRELEMKLNPQEATGVHEKYHPSLAAVWGFGSEITTTIKKDEKKKDDDYDSTPEKEPDLPEVRAKRVGPDDVEADVPWKSAIYFLRLEPAWHVLYEAKSKPVLIERAWGKGTVIVASDSYFVSNEALRNDCRSLLLARLAGKSGRLLFDETHLGTEEQEGIMGLAKRFHLEGYLCGMLGVVVLFCWRNSVPLVPPRPVSDPTKLGGAVSGKDSRSGLVNLLRRNIASAEILKTCMAEWRRNLTGGRAHLQEKTEAMEAVLADPKNLRADALVPTYHQLREINIPSRAKGNYATKS